MAPKTLSDLCMWTPGNSVDTGEDSDELRGSSVDSNSFDIPPKIISLATSKEKSRRQLVTIREIR